VSGLFSKHDRGANPDSTVNGEIEVKDQFAQLDRILKLTGSDFKHLAKATYYVSTDSASVSLNKLRPGYYDPQRPPAASKAIVSSVGFKDLGLTIDMIAVPNSAPAAPMP
jgi:enamine deaminase RidA (YjgF/YER057c/UK114 family)